MNTTNTFFPDFISGNDVAGHNTGGLNRSDTLIDQGDLPVNVIDLKAKAEFMREQTEYEDALIDGYITPRYVESDMHEGVAFAESMYNQQVRKNSDF